MIPTIEFKKSIYPKFQSEGFASKFAFPFALEVCKGHGFDIGCNRIEWKLPGAIPIDPNFGNKKLKWIEINNTCIDYPNDKFIHTLGNTHEFLHAHRFNATHLPFDSVDYIFSSHCLEHLNDWVDVLDYWYDHLKPDGGILFLYLPDQSQKYWLPWHNRKHKNIFTPEIIRGYLIDKGYINIFVSGIDLNNSFMAMAEKRV